MATDAADISPDQRPPVPGLSLRGRSVSRSSIALAGAVLVLSLVAFGLRLNAAEGSRARLSTDEHAYVRLGYDLYKDGTYGDPGMRNPLHWAPATPAMFALAGHLDPGHPLGDARHAGPDRTAQAVVGAATVIAVFGVAALLAGPWAGLAAALVLAVFPPAVLLGASFLSEPLGGFALALAALGLVWAFRGRRRRFAVAGGLLGFACLARADLLSAALLVPVGVALATSGRWRGERLARGAATLAGLLVVLAPWTVYASSQEHRLVPVTTGTGATSFVATYLPGNGTLFGAKQHLLPEACVVRPVLCRLRKRGHHPSAHAILVAVAQHRGPGRNSDVVLRDEAVKNLGRYGLRHPLSFGRMETGKLWRMWGSSFYGPRWRPQPAWLPWVHRGVVLVALLGMVAGVARSRDRRLALLAAVLVAATLLNVLFVAEARANARLVPVLIAAGTAGAVMAVRRGGRRPTTAARAPVPL
ncbi:MAG: hypothetical protein QOH43_163 [Solirubrobacteraceae bacterium]|jgi:4-amino-4-deoxy-L-arabinose transferase-like glycosyltransferase|nr:hypothetical protein [Solirubrobacteraceae bacterium]